MAFAAATIEEAFSTGRSAHTARAIDLIAPMVRAEPGWFAPNIGQKGDPHGAANARLMRGIVLWMEKHAGEIEGLDRSRPLLPQFDLLSDEQMRALFRGMDPLVTTPLALTP